MSEEEKVNHGVDLSLVPIEELVEEIQSRSLCFVASYDLPKDKEKLSTFWYGKGTYYDSCRLTNLLNNEVVNNWSGELDMIRRMNNDGIF